jgi:hypothetical protein
MSKSSLMNPDGTCAKCGHMATEHAEGCSQCDCKLVAIAAKEPKETEGIGNTLDTDYGLTLREP